jgi:hypothetical protein
MKKILTLLILSINWSEAHTQSIIKIAPVNVLNSYINGCFEKNIDANTTFEISGGYAYKINKIQVSVIPIGLGFRSFFAKKDTPPEGFYYMPNVGAAYGKIKSSGKKFSIFDIGVLIGYQNITKGGLVLDIGAGPSYNILDANYSQIFSIKKGFLPNFRLGIGYMFEK